MSSYSSIPLGAVIPVFFDSFAGSTGASITITGLAVTDIEIYKGTSMTQRSSDAGYTLLDTDGIDLDGITGIQGFSIDTGDNTDAGFYAAGSFYNVVVSAITVDSQTVNFVAHRFRLTAAENTTGVPVVDTVRVSGTAQTAGDLAARLPAALVSGRMDSSTGAMAANVLTATAIAADAITAAKVADGTIDAATFAAGALNAAALAADAAVEIADAILDRDMSTGSDSGSTTVRTPRQALRALRNRWVISGGTLTVYKEDDATTSFTSALTGTAGADPVTASDPAGP